MRPVLLCLGDSGTELEHVRLALAVRLYGFDGGLVRLDALLRRHGAAGARRILAGLAEHCRQTHAVLAILTRRKASAVMPLLAALRAGPYRSR